MVLFLSNAIVIFLSSNEEPAISYGNCLRLRAGEMSSSMFRNSDEVLSMHDMNQCAKAMMVASIHYFFRAIVKAILRSYVQSYNYSGNSNINFAPRPEKKFEGAICASHKAAGEDILSQTCICKIRQDLLRFSL